MNQYERLVKQNKELQGELALAKKIIFFLADQIRIINKTQIGVNVKVESIIKIAENEVLKELKELTK